MRIARLRLRKEESARDCESTGSKCMPSLSRIHTPAPAEPEYDPAGHAAQTADEELPAARNGGVMRGCSRPCARSRFSLRDYRQRQGDTKTGGELERRE
jgi:hypothetical protein